MTLKNCKYRKPVNTCKFYVPTINQIDWFKQNQAGSQCTKRLPPKCPTLQRVNLATLHTQGPKNVLIESDLQLLMLKAKNNSLNHEKLLKCQTATGTDSQLPEKEFSVQLN